MAWISVTIILIHCGLIFATGTPYGQSVKRSDKRVILVGSGPLPQYLIQSGYKIVPIYGDFRKLNIPRTRKRIEEKKSVNQKRIFSEKMAPYTSISKKKNIRRKSDISIVNRPANLKNRLTPTFPVSKNPGLALKQFPLKDGQVGIPLITPSEIVIKSPQINVKSDGTSPFLPSSSPQIAAVKSPVISFNTLNKGGVISNPPSKSAPPSSLPQMKSAVENGFVPSQRYQFSAGSSTSVQIDPQFTTVKNNKLILKQLPSSLKENPGTTFEASNAQPYTTNPLVVFPQPDLKQPQLVSKVKNIQQLPKQLPPLSIGTSLKISPSESKPVSSDSPSDYANPAAPLTVVYKQPPVEILKSSQIFSNPEPYAYGYEMGDGLGTTQYRQESTKGDGVVKGNYGYKDYKGLFRQVNYVADEGGFHAVVKSNEPGIGYADSADVKILADYSPS